VLMRGADVPIYLDAAPVIGLVAQGGAAEKAGLKPGDQIARIGNRDVKTWTEVAEAVGPATKGATEVTVVRDGKSIGAEITPSAPNTYPLDSLGLSPVKRPQLTIVNEGGPAARAGLQRGDVITAVNGQRLDQPKIVDLIHASAGKPLTLTIDRAGVVWDVKVTPAGTGSQGLLNVAISESEVRRVEPNLGRAFVMSLDENWSRAGAIGQSLSGLFRGKTSVKELSGPLKIAQLSGEAARMGWLYLLNLMAIISLNLGLINLLPIPVMDGGQIALIGVEGLIQREISVKIKERILLAGAALIVLLMVTVIYNDVMGMMK
jgi:regulator of sigma E protease